jgi:RNA polymerase sigma-70 factor (ECF subfamily)
MRQLVESAVAGDREARNDLLQKHLGSLRAFVRLHLGHGVRSREASMDLVNSVCREALQALPGFEYRGPDSFRNWLLRQAENKIRDRGRFWKRQRRAAARESGSVATLLNHDDESERLAQLRTFCTPSRHASGREELVRAEEAFLNLPPDYREVIVLARVLGMPHAEIARETGRSQAATRTLLSRALARMATLLDESGSEQGEFE